MTCQNKARQEVCKRFQNCVPCCEDISKVYPCVSQSSVNPNELFIADIFDWVKPVAANNLLKLRSHGVCMYPYLRPGDVLCIQAKTTDQIQVGEVAVFKKGDYLCAHRTISRGILKDKPYIVTRSDRAEECDDGPIFGEDILGVVSDVERKGKKADKEAPRTRAMSSNIYLKWHILKKKFLAVTIRCISPVQRNRVYRKISQFWFVISRKNINLSIRVPLNLKINSKFYQEATLKDLKLFLSETSNLRAIAAWSMVASVDSKFAGVISFLHKPQDCPFSGWWIVDLTVRIRYRGLGLEERLLNEAEAILNEFKAKELLVSLLKDKDFKREVFAGFGFKAAPRFNEALLNAGITKTNLPVVMYRQLVEKN